MISIFFGSTHLFLFVAFVLTPSSGHFLVYITGEIFSARPRRGYKILSIVSNFVIFGEVF